MNRYIVDTNVWLDYPQIIEEKDFEIFVPTSVLKELDGLKKSNNSETAFNARRAAIDLSRHIDKIHWIDAEQYNNLKIPVDDQLIKFCQDKSIPLLTNDIYLKVRAKIEGIQVEGYSRKDTYDGAYYWYLNNDNYEDIFTNIYETREVPNGIELYENEYVIVKNTDFPIVNRNGEEDYDYINSFVYRDGELRGIKDCSIKNKFIDCIVPKNPEQACLFDALENRKATIIYAGGKFGTGKSFILNNFALQELEKGKISKIVYIPNNSYTENAMEIGFLPGC